MAAPPPIDLSEWAARLGIRLPGAGPKPKKKRTPSALVEPRPGAKGFKNGTPYCRKGHPYGDHKKLSRREGKTYEVRYCRVCATENERARKARQREAAS